MARTLSGVRDRWRLVGFATDLLWECADVFDLVTETGQIQLLYGVNGAGKSVTLRSLRLGQTQDASIQAPSLWHPRCIAVQVYGELVSAEVEDDFDPEVDGDPLSDPLCHVIAEALAGGAPTTADGEPIAICQLALEYLVQEFRDQPTIGASDLRDRITARLAVDPQVDTMAKEIAAQGLFLVSRDGFSIAAVADNSAPTFRADASRLAFAWEQVSRGEDAADWITAFGAFEERMAIESVLGPDGSEELADPLLAHLRAVEGELLSGGEPRSAISLTVSDIHGGWAFPGAGVIQRALDSIVVVGPAFDAFEQATRSWLTLELLGTPDAALLCDRPDDREAFQAELLTACARLEAAASARFQSLLPGAPALSLALPTAVQVLAEDYAMWRVRGRGDGSVVAESYATQRLIALAVTLAIVEHSEDAHVRVLLLDEPELGLHRQAQRRLFAALECLAAEPGNIVVCATHSEIGLGLRSATLHHVRRSDSGAIERARMRAVNRQYLEELGLGAGDVLQLTRVILLVEGRHDELVLRTLFADDIGGLDDLGVHVVAMHGGRNAASVVDSGLLWDFTNARIAVVLDRVPHETLAPVWADALRAHREGEDPSQTSARFRAAVDSVVAKALPRNAKADELTWIKSLGSRALERGYPDRLSLLGLPEDDVLAYLPADALGAATWQEAKKRGLTDDDVVRAVDALHRIPDDLLALRDAIAHLAG